MRIRVRSQVQAAWLSVVFLIINISNAHAQAPITAGPLVAYSTQHSIGVEWTVANDIDHDAIVDVLYRESPSGGWRPASRLIRVDDGTHNMLAGSVMFLTPGTRYDIRLSLFDPDGGGETRELSVRTVPIPTMPTGGRVFHVRAGWGGGDGSVGAPFGGIEAAQAVARPGDTFLLHAGVYEGRAWFYRPGGEGAYIVWKAAGDGEVTLGGIDITASHIWLDGVTVRDQYYAMRTGEEPLDVVLKRSTFLNNVYSIFLNGGGAGWYIADNTIIGANPLGSESFEGEGIELNSTSGHTVAHNSISHVADGVSYPHTNVDIFGNDIFDTSDDGLELDYGRANVRAWGNRIHNAVHNGVSFQPQQSGPWYIIRNQIVGSAEAPLKFRSTDRFVLVHNTIVNYEGSMICCNASHLLRGFVRNNLWISAQGGQILALEALNDWRTDIDYDGFDWGDALYPLVFGGSIYYDIESFSRASGLEAHGIRIVKEHCFTDFRVPGAPPTPVPPQVMGLRPECAAVDAGALLPNLNDRFAGAAPDLGAHETGMAPSWYGPRLTDEPSGGTNPSPGSDPAPGGSDPIPVGAQPGDADQLPTPWAVQDVGSVGIPGSATLNGQTWTLQASGADVWDATDAFGFAFQRLTGDGVIVARVVSVTNVDDWTKAGIMMRATLDPHSPHAFLFVTPAQNGVAFQRRVTAGGATTHTSGGAGTAPVWIRLSRAGDTFTAARSSDGAVWTTIGSETMAAGATIYAGLALVSHDNTRRAGAVFDAVSVVTGETLTLAGPSAPWNDRSIGDASGHASVTGGEWTVSGSGADIWDSADAFHFVSHPLSGDGSITVRVTGVAPGHEWGKAGVMLRGSFAPGSPHAFAFVTPAGANGVAFQRRVGESWPTWHTAGGAGSAPVWLRLRRVGSQVIASRSWDGQTWSLIGVEDMVLPPTIYAGLAVTSHASGNLSATFDHVGVVPASDDTTFHNHDIGNVAIPGQTAVTGTTLTVSASGADIWDTTDAFHYAYRSVTGNFDAIARVRSVEAVDQWTKAGLMVRVSADAASAHAMVVATPSAVNGVAFQRRVVSGGMSDHTAGPPLAPSVWLRLIRQGEVITAFSRTGTDDPWVVIGSESIAIPPAVLVGVAVTSHHDGTLASAIFEEVSIYNLP